MRMRDAWLIHDILSIISHSDGRFSLHESGLPALLGVGNGIMMLIIIKLDIPKIRILIVTSWCTLSMLQSELEFDLNYTLLKSGALLCNMLQDMWQTYEPRWHSLCCIKLGKQIVKWAVKLEWMRRQCTATEMMWWRMQRFLTTNFLAYFKKLSKGCWIFVL